MAETRKELEETALGTGLERTLVGLRQGPSRSALLVLGGGLLLALLVVAGTWMWNSSEQRNSDRWVRLDDLAFPGQVGELLKEKDLAGTAQGRIGRYIDARLKLREGLRNLASDSAAVKEKAVGSLESGVATYEDLLKGEKSALLRQEALLGAAKGRETLNQRPRAVELYRQLARDYPNTPLAREAEGQARRLEEAGNQADLDALAARLTPPPPAPKPQ